MALYSCVILFSLAEEKTGVNPIAVLESEPKFALVWLHVVLSRSLLWCPALPLFLPECSLPDTLNSWFLVAQLHVWWVFGCIIATLCHANSKSCIDYSCKAVVSNLSYEHPCPAHLVCLPYQTDLIQALWSLLTSWWVESGLSDKGDILNVQGRGACRTGLKSTRVKHWVD